jgi:hypothetical protein
VTVEVNVEAVVVAGWADWPTWLSMVSATGLAPGAVWTERAVDPVLVLLPDWTASVVGALWAGPVLSVVAVARRRCAEGDLVTPAARWPDAGSAGGVAGGSSLAGVLAAAPDSTGLVPTGPGPLPSLADAAAEVNRSSEPVLAVADGLEPVSALPLLDTTRRAGCPIRGRAGAEAPADPAVEVPDAALDEPGEDCEDAEELVDDEARESDDELEGAAHATPYPLATAAPMPRATANPPTRPTYAAELVMEPSPCDRDPTTPETGLTALSH